MAAQETQSRLAAFITLFLFLAFILAISWGAFYLSTNSNRQGSGEPTPTPTPQPGVFNIDEQLDMLN